MTEYKLFPFKKTWMEDQYGEHTIHLQVFSNHSELEEAYGTMTMCKIGNGAAATIPTAYIGTEVVGEEYVPNTDPWCTIMLGTQLGTMTITHEATHAALFHEEEFEEERDYFGDDGDSYGYERLPYKVGYIARTIVDLLYEDGFYPEIKGGKE
jgi:hypothetical protein